MSDIPAYDIPLLENLEQMLCPTCDGRGTPADPGWIRGQLGLPVRCTTCNGEKRIWRIKAR